MRVTNWSPPGHPQDQPLHCAGDEWTADEDLARKLKPGSKFDGLFWMVWDDFEWCADTLTIAPAKIPVKRAAHEEEDSAGED